MSCPPVGRRRRRLLAAAGLIIAVIGAVGSGSGGQIAGPPAAPIWIDVTAETIGDTAGWTNKVELADLDADGRLDLLFANGGNYSEPGTPEQSLAFFNNGPGQLFTNRSERVFGPMRAIARVIKARDLTADGIVDIIVGTTYETQSQLFEGLGQGEFRNATPTHLPQTPASLGDLEAGDVDGDGDLDLVLADWGPGNNMTNAGGRTRLWLNDGRGRFTDATAARMPDVLVRFSWDLELADVENDGDLDVLVSCKRCTGGYLFRNDGSGMFTEVPGALPQYTNNYEYEPMDLDGDGFLDLVTVNDGEIVKEGSANRREHVLRNDGKGRFRDATAQRWPNEHNIGEDDNMVAFLDYDSDGDADFVIGSLSGPDRLIVNDGTGGLSMQANVFDGAPTPGTLGLALGDLDGDGRMDVVQAQGEHPKAVQERVFFGRGLAPDRAPPVITPLAAPPSTGGAAVLRARVHDRKSPLVDGELKEVVVEWTAGSGPKSTTRMQWYGEYLWRATQPDGGIESYRFCATDGGGNRACSVTVFR